MKDKYITKIPIEKAITPFDGAIVIADRWWTVVDECILFYKETRPQCNSHKEVAEHLNKRLYPNAECRFIPVVYVEHRCEL